MKPRSLQSTPNRTLVQSLIVNHSDVMPIVKSVCRQKHSGAPTHVDYQDIVGAAFLGIADAKRKYRKGKNTKFTSYATTRVTGSVKDYIRKEYTYARRYVVTDEFPDSFQNSSMQSSEVTRLCNRDLFESVCKMLSELPPNQFDAVVGIYLDERPERDLADEMSVSVGALRRLAKQALETVRSRFLASNPGRQRAWIED